MSDQSVFNQNNDNSGQPAQQEPSQSNPFADQLQGIKNEDGNQKYDTIEKALDGLAHAQSYIPQLKDQVSSKDAEIASLKAELEQRQSVEDVVSRLTSQPAAQEPQVTPQESQGLSAEQVAEIVQQKLVQTQQHQVQQTNQQKVNSGLIAKFGDKAGEVVSNKAKELNTTPQQLEQMAATNPDMVLALFNTQPTSGVKPTTGSIHISPADTPEQPPLERPEKSLLAGATSAQQKEFMKKIKEETYRKFGVVT